MERKESTRTIQNIIQLDTLSMPLKFEQRGERKGLGDWPEGIIEEESGSKFVSGGREERKKEGPDSPEDHRFLTVHGPWNSCRRFDGITEGVGDGRPAGHDTKDGGKERFGRRKTAIYGITCTDLI